MNNKVELVGYYGGDQTHALSAWTSTDRDISEEKQLRRGPLLSFLANNKHETPFEKSMLHFLVTCETASHIHILKHRIGVSVNGESARYKEHTVDKYYIPEDWPQIEKDRLTAHAMESYDLYHKCIARLEAQGIDRKRAKESARMYLPYASQLTLDVSFNFRSFHHFLELRKKPDAQLEINEIATQMLDQVTEIPGGPFDETLEAFGYGDR